MTNTARQLAVEHIPFVDFLIQRHISADKDLHDDIRSACLEALVLTADNYRPDAGVKFRTYLEPRIRGAIVDTLRETLPIPSLLRRKKKKVRSVEKELEKRLGRQPEKDEVCAELGIPCYSHLSPEGAMVKAEMPCFVSVDEDVTVSEGEVVSLLDIIPDRRPSPEDALFANELQEIVNAILLRYSKRNQEIIKRYLEGDSMGVAGDPHGISESRVCQVLSTFRAQVRARVRR